MIDDEDYQRYPYVFGTIRGYETDMTGPIREAARATLRDLIGTPFNLLEIGVWEGRSACWMLDNVLTHPDAHYLGIDPWVSPPQVPITARKHLAYHGSKAHLIEKDSKQVVPGLAQEFQVVVVDGNHTFEGCYADLVNTWEKLLPGGVVICDDYAYPGLPGVPAAVDRFLDERQAHLSIQWKGVALAFRKEVGP